LQPLLEYRGADTVPNAIPNAVPNAVPNAIAI
jgi:hypothetical protein